MSESAEALAANLTSRRNVTIEITNVTNNFCLLDPVVYLDSGHCHSPPQPIVRPLKTEVCNFSKTSGKTSGAAGVLTYDIFVKGRGVQEVLAIMFSVPYDYTGYKNWHGLAIYKKDKDCDKNLFKEMYYDKEQKDFARLEAKGCCLTFQGETLDVMATMSPLGKAIMKVELWEKVFSPPTSQTPF